MLKPLTVLIITNFGKLLERWEYKTIFLSPEKPICGSRSKARTLFGTTDWFRTEKGVQTGLSAVTLSV